MFVKTKMTQQGTTEKPGIISRALDLLFGKMKSSSNQCKYSVEVCFFVSPKFSPIILACFLYRSLNSKYLFDTCYATATSTLCSEIDCPICSSLLT